MPDLLLICIFDSLKFSQGAVAYALCICVAQSNPNLQDRGFPNGTPGVALI